jgi:hypothetical protein
MAATGQIMAAFETVAGSTLTSEQRVDVYTSLNAALDRAAVRTTADMDVYQLYEPGAAYVNPNERMELNFRDVVREMTPAVPGMNIQDLPSPLFRGPINEEGTLAEGRTFFNNLPPDEADARTRQGMDAAITIMRAYQDRFGDRTVTAPLQQDSLYDTKVWSLQRFVPSFDWRRVSPPVFPGPF